MTREWVRGITMHGEYFAVQRPDGRLSRRVFYSPYRAAEHVMRAARVDYWPELEQRGVRVVAVDQHGSTR